MMKLPSYLALGLFMTEVPVVAVLLIWGGLACVSGYSGPTPETVDGTLMIAAGLSPIVGVWLLW